jgi:hypothetical protein
MTNLKLTSKIQTAIDEPFVPPSDGINEPRDGGRRFA